MSTRHTNSNPQRPWPLRGKLWKRLGLSAGISVVAFGVVVTGLVVFSPTPAPQGDAENLDFEALSTDDDKLPELQSYMARDGEELPFRHYASPGTDTTVILLHGSAYHSSYLQPLASYLADNGIAAVYTPDLRGHGPMTERRGDVDYIGQLEDDVSDLVAYVRQQQDGPIVLGGHSSGGGTVIRYAGGENTPVDGYLMLAPYVHYDASTIADSGSSWSNVNLPRMIGLSILNTFGITVFNHLDVISFNMLTAARDGTETLHYSYTLQISMHPRDDYDSDIAELDEPSFLVVGADDEVFDVDAFVPLFAADSPSTTVTIMPRLTHFGVVTEHSAEDAVANWLQSTF